MPSAGRGVGDQGEGRGGGFRGGTVPGVKFAGYQEGGGARGQRKNGRADEGEAIGIYPLPRKLFRLACPVWLSADRTCRVLRFSCSVCIEIPSWNRSFAVSVAAQPGIHKQDIYRRLDSIGGRESGKSWSPAKRKRGPSEGPAERSSWGKPEGAAENRGAGFRMGPILDFTPGICKLFVNKHADFCYTYAGIYRNLLVFAVWGVLRIFRVLWYMGIRK